MKRSPEPPLSGLLFVVFLDEHGQAISFVLPLVKLNKRIEVPLKGEEGNRCKSGAIPSL